MGLLTGIGRGIGGLLGNDQFLDRLAQAQAFANGDPMTAVTIGARIMDRRGRRDPQGGIASPGPGSARPEPLSSETWWRQVPQPWLWPAADFGAASPRTERDHRLTGQWIA